MKRLILYILLIFVSISAVAVPADTLVVDSVRTSISKPVSSAVILDDSIPLTQKEIDRLFWKPDPMRAVWLGTIVPGLGQIYNRSYWKLPIVYGGFMGCIFAITYTSNMYEGYKTAYRDI